MRAQGLGVVRGSSSRGGASCAQAACARTDGPLDAAFAVDGPRGPRGRAKPGVALAARLARARLVPMGARRLGESRAHADVGSLPQSHYRSAVSRSSWGLRSTRSSWRTARSCSTMVSSRRGGAPSLLLGRGTAVLDPEPGA